tara:strand:+ start:424 stop:1377 length:954 start_codon:yes stop_codon:yes gene_type:complete
MNNLDDIITPTFKWLKDKNKVAIATVISTWGSAPRQVGGQMAINETGEIIGSVSGGCVENSVITEALDSLKDKKHRIKDYGITNDLAWEVGLACGGNLKILINPLEDNDKIIFEAKKMIQKRERIIIKIDCKTGRRDVISTLDQEKNKTSYFDYDKEVFYHIIDPKPRLFIIGGVHLSQALSSLANICEYEVVIIDPRDYFANKKRFPNDLIINDWPDIALKNYKFNCSDNIVTLTHDPKIDDLALTLALNSKVGYIGSLGSKKTHENRVERLKNEGFALNQIDKIHAPIGLNISSKTPQEIALSIMAEIIKVRRSF